MTESLQPKETPSALAENFVNRMIDRNPTSERYGQFLGEDGKRKEGEIRNLISHYVWLESGFPNTDEGHHRASEFAFKAYNEALWPESPSQSKDDPFEIQRQIDLLREEEEKILQQITELGVRLDESIHSATEAIPTAEPQTSSKEPVTQTTEQRIEAARKIIAE